MAEHGQCHACSEHNAGQGRSTQRGLLVEGQEAQPFVHFHSKEEPKVKNLSNNSPLCSRSQTVSCSHDQPQLLFNGGRPVCPCLDPCLDVFKALKELIQKV